MVSLPPAPLIVTAVTSVNSALATPARLITFAASSPVTVIEVMSAHAAAPLPGSAPLIFTSPLAQVIAIASPAVLVTVSAPAPSTAEFTAAFAMPGNASRAAAAAPASTPRRTLELLCFRATSAPLGSWVRGLRRLGAALIPVGLVTRDATPRQLRARTALRQAPGAADPGGQTAS